MVRQFPLRIARARQPRQARTRAAGQRGRRQTADLLSHLARLKKIWVCDSEQGVAPKRTNTVNDLAVE